MSSPPAHKVPAPTPRLSSNPPTSPTTLLLKKRVTEHVRRHTLALLRRPALRSNLGAPRFFWSFAQLSPTCLGLSARRPLSPAISGWSQKNNATRSRRSGGYQQSSSGKLTTLPVACSRPTLRARDSPDLETQWRIESFFWYGSRMGASRWSLF